MTRRIHSFVWSGIVATILLAFGIYELVMWGRRDEFFIFLGLAVVAFTFVSCLILNNNVVGSVVGEIFSWGFVSLPGLIFELSLDGIIWLLTVKLIFWVLGLILAVICGLLAIVIGGIVSLFVYPFALVKNIRGVEA